MRHIAAGPELRWRGFAVGQQVALAEQALELAGHGGAGVDEDDAGGSICASSGLRKG